jgi:hypothetical protein
VTILRKGAVDESARAAESDPVPANKGLPKLLENDLKRGSLETRGVIFTCPGDKKKKHKWHRTRNDSRKEDLYVMAAPITIRRSAPDGSLHREMAMILYANHANNVFPPWICDIVRCCVDTVSTALSVGMQLAEQAERSGAAPASGGLVVSGGGAQVTGASVDTHANSDEVEERTDASNAS